MAVATYRECEVEEEGGGDIPFFFSFFGCFFPHFGWRAAERSKPVRLLVFFFFYFYPFFFFYYL